MLPLLKYAGDKNEHHIRDAIEQLAKEFGLKEEERKEVVPSGQQLTFDNRVSWAKTYLKKAGLVESTRRGYFRITERGVSVLEDRPDKINMKYLERYPEFTEFRNSSKSVIEESGDVQEYEESTPEELMGIGHRKLQNDLAYDLLDNIKRCSPGFFERLVIDLLVKIGYGGSREDAASRVTGKSGDEGIDGTINEDKLGLDTIYVQAKKWENTVGRPEIQKFAGSIESKRIRKGVFITTSNFSQEAYEYVNHIEKKIILIDGQKLAELTIDYNVGLSCSRTYILKKIDSDYFDS